MEHGRIFLLDAAMDLVTRRLVTVPVIGSIAAVNWTPLLERVELAARTGAQLCAFGVGLIVLTLWSRKLYLTFRGQPVAAVSGPKLDEEGE